MDICPRSCFKCTTCRKNYQTETNNRNLCCLHWNMLYMIPCWQNRIWKPTIALQEMHYECTAGKEWERCSNRKRRYANTPRQCLWNSFSLFILETIFVTFIMTVVNFLFHLALTSLRYSQGMRVIIWLYLWKIHFL